MSRLAYMVVGCLWFSVFFVRWACFIYMSVRARYSIPVHASSTITLYRDAGSDPRG